MKIALTGASGHIGAAVCRTLLQRGHTVRALIHHDNYALRDLDIEQIKGDLTDQNSLSNCFRGSEAVIHMAGLISIGGIPAKQLMAINIDGTRNMLEACRLSGVRRLVHFSSVHAYQTPPPDQVFDERAPLADTSRFPYVQSKARAQRIVAGTNDLETIILNPSSVLGPWDYKPSLQGKMLLDLAQGRIPMLPAGGFDWVDSRDIAEAAEAALTKGRLGQAYLLAGHFASAQEIAGMVAAYCDRKAPGREAPFWLLKTALPFLSAWSKLRHAQPLYTSESLAYLKEGHPNIVAAKAAEAFGFQARPLEETLRDSLSWILEFAKTGRAEAAN